MLVKFCTLRNELRYRATRKRRLAVLILLYIGLTSCLIFGSNLTQILSGDYLKLQYRGISTGNGTKLSTRNATSVILSIVDITFRSFSMQAIALGYVCVGYLITRRIHRSLIQLRSQLNKPILESRDSSSPYIQLDKNHLAHLAAFHASIRRVSDRFSSYFGIVALIWIGLYVVYQALQLNTVVWMLIDSSGHRSYYHDRRNAIGLVGRIALLAVIIATTGTMYSFVVTRRPLSPIWPGG